MQNTTAIVVIGAGYAGLTCALRMARKGRGRAHVTLVNGSDHFVERIRLHEQAAGRLPHSLPLMDMVRDSGVQLRIGWVRRIDPSAQTLDLDDGEQLAWDRLVLALGSQVDLGRVPGARELAYTLDAPGALALHAALPGLAARAGRVVVVGGGLTGIEAASELAEAHPGLSVMLLTRGQLAPECSEGARTYFRKTLQALRVEVREQAGVRAVHPGVVDTESGPVEADACIWSVGLVASPLARSAGLAVNESGQVWVDAQLRSISHPSVHVAGDLAVHRDQAQRPVPMGCKSALPTGAHVGDNLARLLLGQREQPFSYVTVPYCVSLGRRNGLLELPAVGRHARRGLIRGALAARIKELICRGTLWALALERRRAALASWLRPTRAPRLPASTSTPQPSQQPRPQPSNDAEAARV